MPEPLTDKALVEGIRVEMQRFEDIKLDMRHIQYQGETLPPSLPPLVLSFHLVLGKFHIYNTIGMHVIYHCNRKIRKSFKLEQCCHAHFLNCTTSCLR